jgi:hypothetical protein
MKKSTEKGLEVTSVVIRNGGDNFLPVSYPVKAAPAEKNEEHVDPNYHLDTHGASLPSEVGGERINICQIFQSVYGKIRHPDGPRSPIQSSMCKWLANNKQNTRSMKSSFNYEG